jgi:hypothetical protein
MCQVSPEMTTDGESPMARQRSCGCCRWYEIAEPCLYYAACKGSLFGGASYFEYSEGVE